MVGGDVATISSDFVRTYKTAASTDVIRGTFHYLGPGNIFFEVTDPLHQILLIDRTETIIFYPDKNSGFRFKGNGGMQILPMIPGVFAALQPDYGLSELGYAMYDQEVVADTLVTMWRNAAAGDDIGEFRLARHRDNLAYVAYDPPGDAAQIRTTFSEYMLIGEVSVPMRLQTVTITADGPATGTLQLSDLAFDRTIPDRVRNFEIPEDARLEERTW
jgi:outer membrane lipoprotein-sorting protein